MYSPISLFYQDNRESSRHCHPRILLLSYNPSCNAEISIQPTLSRLVSENKNLVLSDHKNDPKPYVLPESSDL